MGYYGGDEAAFQVFPVADDDLEIWTPRRSWLTMRPGWLSRVTVVQELKRLTSIMPVGIGHPADLFG